MGAEGAAFALQASGRLALYLCVFLLTGLAVFRTGIVGRLAREHAAVQVGQLDATLSRGALWVSGTLLLVCIYRLFAQVFAIFGVDEGVTLDGFQIVALQTPWGLGWRLQLAASAVVAVAVVLAWKRVALAWSGVLVAALGLVLTVPLTGHAVSQSTSVLVGVGLQVLHVGGGSVWIGTLLVVYAFGLRHVGGGDSARWQSSVIRRFSPIALGAVGALLSAGVVTAFLYLDSWDQLTNTAYGRTLLGKIVFFAGTGLVGAYNWRVLRPRLGAAGSELALRRSIAAELIVALIVLGVTAVMVALPLEH